MTLPGRYPAVASLAAGLAMPLAFAPFELFFVAPLSLACLFLAWIDAPPRRRLAAGFLFGLGMFGAGVSWVYISLSRFGDMPVALAVASVAGFVAVLSLYPALAAAVALLFRRAGRGATLIVVFPLTWTAVEILRNHLFTGFSWLEAGYSQTSTPLGHWGAVFGVHGVTLLTAICAGLLAQAASGGRHRIILLAAVVLPFAGGLLLSRIPWTTPVGEPLRAALVQGAVPLATKWNFADANAVARRYLALSREVEDVDVIIWPESPLPFFIDQMGSRFYDELVKLPAPVLSGFLERRPRDGGGFDYHNSAILFSEPVQIYRKTHLVPFGEYTPLPWLFEPIVAYFDVPMSVLTPWRGSQRPVSLAGRKAGISICYEDAFPEDIRRFARDSDLLVNITEDAWFGDSLAPYQRLQMARMRTIETARPMLRASNTGLAAAIDHRGAIVAQSRQFEEQVLVTEVQPRTGVTPYVRHGDYPVLALLAVGLLGGLRLTRARSRVA